MSTDSSGLTYLTGRAVKRPYQAVCPLRMENLGNCSHFKVSKKYPYNLRILAVRTKSMFCSDYPHTIIRGAYVHQRLLVPIASMKC